MKMRILIGVSCCLVLLSHGCFLNKSTTGPQPAVDQEFETCWQFLQWFLIFQDSLPANPYDYDSPSALYKSVNEPYTRYIPPDSAAIFLAGLTTQSSAGIGILVDSVYNGLVLKEVFPNTPGEAAGLLQKDTLISVNDSVLAGRDFGGMVGFLRGDAGEQKVLGIKRDTLQTTITVTLGPFMAPSVITDSLDSAIAYIRLTQFSDSTVNPNGSPAEFRDALVKTAWAEYTILDLQSNGGGLIGECIDIAGEFVPANTGIATFHERQVVLQANEWVASTHDTVYRTDSAGIAQTRKFVIIVDWYTASAAEILVSSLRDQRAFTVIGSKTFGKARGQVVLETPDTGLAKITYATLTPVLGDNYDLVGISPDIETQDPSTAQSVALTHIKQLMAAPASKQMASAAEKRINRIRLQTDVPWKGPMGVVRDPR